MTNVTALEIALDLTDLPRSQVRAFAERLRGETRDELAADAAVLLKSWKTTDDDPTPDEDGMPAVRDDISRLFPRH